MAREMLLLAERLVADGTRERFLASVHSDVVAEVLLCREHLIAEIAVVGRLRLWLGER